MTDWQTLSVTNRPLIICKGILLRRLFSMTWQMRIVMLWNFLYGHYRIYLFVNKLNNANVHTVQKCFQLFWVGLPRVLEYYLSSKLLENFLLLEYSNFYFRLQISISGCSFLQSVDNLLEFKQFMQTWGFAISFATGQLGHRSEYIHVEGVLRSLRLPRYAGPQVHHPFFVIGGLY